MAEIQKKSSNGVAIAFVINSIWIPYAVVACGIWIGLERRSDGDWLGMEIIAWTLLGALAGSALGLLMCCIAFAKKMPLAWLTLISGIPSMLLFLASTGLLLKEIVRL